ncbi:MAG: ComF family protein [Burkholderiaceae bacterium]|jgi:ComF family protein|nr:ComF family protein [Burkholderiaceae bacterium]
MFTALLDRIADGLPSQCLICRAWPARPLCADCAGRFTPWVRRCTTCALPVPEGVTHCGACLRDPPPFNACHAAVDYGWPWTACMARFKFHGQPQLARALAALLMRDAAVTAAIAQADSVLPIPMTPQRLAERGYNPAWLLVRQLTRPIAPRKARADVLLRIRESAPQRELGRRERIRNLRGAFMAQPGRGARTRDQRVVLVDDVMTTGATLREAAGALRQAGAAHITAIVFARTPEPGG